MQWNTYNDALVKRGEILLDFSTLETWNHEVKRMNVGKRGAPYTYPESLITVLATSDSSSISPIDSLKECYEVYLSTSMG
jgi:hypothetical protein